MNLSEKKKHETAYQDLRRRILALRPEEIGISLEKDSEVYAALVDFKVPSGAVSLACLLDGTVSFYYSLGGGMLGMGQKYEQVRKAGLALLASAGQTLAFLQPAMGFALSEEPCSIFLLAKNCIYRADFSMDEMERQPRHIQLLNLLIQNTLKSLRAHSDER